MGLRVRVPQRLPSALGSGSEIAFKKLHLFDSDQGNPAANVVKRRRTLLKEDAMPRLAMVLFSIISTSLMGVAIIATLTMGYGTLRPILLAAAIGFVLAIPVSLWVARQISAR
jgi:hypothetical protein